MSRYVVNRRVMLFSDMIAAKIWWTRRELNILQMLADGSANNSATWN
jgi:DNA-binding NarL/FixJ family response regulator